MRISLFDFFLRSSCEKEFLFGLLSYHLLLFVMEWRAKAKGSTWHHGGAYMHSMPHWFDEVDAVSFGVGDEPFEHENGMRKVSIRKGGWASLERDLLVYELGRRNAGKHFVDVKEEDHSDEYLKRFELFIAILFCLKIF